MRLRLALVGISLFLGLAGPAHADPETDTQFRDTLTAAGITFQDPDQVVATGKNVCRLITEGQSAPRIVAILVARNPELTPELAEKFVGISVRSYCPDKLVHNDAGDSND